MRASESWAVGAALALVVGCGSDSGGGDDDDTALPLTTVDTAATSTGDDDDDDDAVDLSRDGTCLRVGGGQDRVRAIDAVVPTGRDPRTVQAWVRTDSASGEQVAVGMGLAAPELGFYLGTADGYAMASSAGLPVADPDHFVADGRWHHLLATFADDEVTLWVDGERGVRTELVSDTADGEVVAGGTPTGQSKPWDGWLDDVKIYSRQRTDADILADLDGDEQALALWWDFEVRGEGAGITVPDASGGGAEGVTGGTDESPAFRSCP